VPSADVVVVGAGLAGMAAAIALADAGSRVEVIARGHAATHWTSGGMDVAAPRGTASATPADGVRRLAAREGHPYTILAPDVRPSIDWLLGVLAAEGLTYEGALDDPIRPVPTAIGVTRPAGVLPAAQAAAREPWLPGERLVVCGPAGFKDFWPGAIGASLRRATVWGGSTRVADRPATIEAVVAELPGLSGRRNLNAMVLARLFDDPAWSAEAFGAIADAVDRAGGGGPGRIALPAVLGLDDHARVMADARRLLPLPAFEVPLVPPSIPGLRLFNALRAAFRRRGGRIMVGEEVVRIETADRRVTAVAAAAAARDRVVTTGGVVLATGGIAGGGLIGRDDGVLEEPLLGLPVEAPPLEAWLAPDPFDPAGHPLEAAGIRTDASLRPVDRRGRVALANVAIAGSLLAGQRYLTERCGDGVAIASGQRAASLFLAKAAPRASRQKAGAAR
jgi:glycerol-3-phosphate dehydrogenase subunit B